MRGKATALMALGLALAAPRAFAQHSDLLPRHELRLRLNDDLRDRFSAREFSARVRTQALATARIARAEAQRASRAARAETRAFGRLQHVRTVRIHVPRIRHVRGNIRRHRII